MTIVFLQYGRNMCALLFQTYCTKHVKAFDRYFGFYLVFIYSRFQVTFQSAFPKFVLNIPNYITKFGILRENVQSEIYMLVN